MRPLKINDREEVGGGHMMGKTSLVPAVQDLWNVWEIHCLILISLFLQVFLFLFAGIRRHNSSWVLGTVLWLAYLSADSVAIFVLGHLAVRASEPGHQLMSFWAPFVLVHLGGQDNITALSREDNQLWKRQLLSFATQVAVAGYVVAMASWPDGRLRAAMVLMFLSGCFKYAERILCLLIASPEVQRLGVLSNLSALAMYIKEGKTLSRTIRLTRTYRMMCERDSIEPDHRVTVDIMSAEAPLNKVETILEVDDLPGMLATYLPSADRYRRAYEYVGATLVNCYQYLYTKKPLARRRTMCGVLCRMACCISTITCRDVLFLLYNLFQCASAPAALILYTAAEKRNHIHSSRADITVAYILLVGAIVLDVSSAIMSCFSNFIIPLPAWSTNKQWSEELAQYNMIKRFAVQQDTACRIRQWIGKLLGGFDAWLIDVTRKPINEDHTPIKGFVLDNLFASGIRKEWNIASFRGQLALQKWMGSHEDPDSLRTGKALEMSICVDFPTSVLIWHIATDMCYYCGDDDASTDSDSEQTKKHKQVSRELSNYIMYLVFSCGVMLTTNSQLVHHNAHDEIRTVLSDQDLGEKAAAMKLFKPEEGEHQDSTAIEIQKLQALEDNNSAAGGHMQKLLQSAGALDSPMLPRAREVARGLLSITNETDRWGLIAAVWSEMLFYTAPRCGGAFHYEHLCTGGEFITHVLLLMRSLGPFLPPPDAYSGP